MAVFFFFNDPATTEIYSLSLHDALPIFDLVRPHAAAVACDLPRDPGMANSGESERLPVGDHLLDRSEEHTSELQSHSDLVCRLLLEKKKEEALISLVLI